MVEHNLLTFKGLRLRIKGSKVLKAPTFGMVLFKGAWWKEVRLISMGAIPERTTSRKLGSLVSHPETFEASCLGRLSIH